MSAASDYWRAAFADAPGGRELVPSKAIGAVLGAAGDASACRRRHAHHAGCAVPARAVARSAYDCQARHADPCRRGARSCGITRGPCWRVTSSWPSQRHSTSSTCSWSWRWARAESYTGGDGASHGRLDGAAVPNDRVGGPAASLRDPRPRPASIRRAWIGRWRRWV